MKTPDEIKRENPKCPWCGHEMRFDADSAHVWFKCDSCLASSPKTERVWISDKHNSENWAINERNALATCMLILDHTTKWISVEERLPESSACAIAICDDGFMILTSYYGGHWNWNGRHEDSVTHWMPLPEQPKEE